MGAEVLQPSQPDGQLHCLGHTQVLNMHYCASGPVTNLATNLTWSLSFCSPEMLTSAMTPDSGVQVEPCAHDIWSIGVVMLRLLSSSEGFLPPGSDEPFAAMLTAHRAWVRSSPSPSSSSGLLTLLSCMRLKHVNRHAYFDGCMATPQSSNNVSVTAIQCANVCAVVRAASLLLLTGCEL